MQPFVEDFLLASGVEFRRGLALSQGRAAGVRAATVRRDAGALVEAIVAVGLLDDQEANEARERLVAAALDAREPGAVNPSAQQRVFQRFGALVDQAAERPTVEERNRLLMAVGALEDIGVFDADQRSELNESLGRVVPAEERQPPPPSTEQRRERHEFLGEDLTHVVAGPPERMGGVRLTGVELYTDGVVVRLHVLTPRIDIDSPGANWPDERHPDLASEHYHRLGLSDDVGTPYRPRGGGGAGQQRGAGLVMRRVTVFAPAVPAQASQLVLADVGGRRRFEVGLR
jgi:hypothetical protein